LKHTIFAEKMNRNFLINDLLQFVSKIWLFVICRDMIMSGKFDIIIQKCNLLYIIS
jgi:hypothetical protein